MRKLLLLTAIVGMTFAVKGQSKIDSLESKINNIELHLAKSQGFFRTSTGLVFSGATLIILGCTGLDNKQIKNPDFYRGVVVVGSLLTISGGVVFTFSHKEIGIAGNWKTKEVNR